MTNRRRCRRSTNACGATCRQNQQLSFKTHADFSNVLGAGGVVWLRMAALPVVSAAVAFVVYCNTLTADFVYDDNRAILTNPDVLSSSSWTSLLADDFWGTPLSHASSHQSYRPLTVLTFRANHAVHGFEAAGYHGVNVLLHCVVSALFAHLAAAHLGSACSAGSRVAAILFAVHPVHCEAVAGLVGRADLLAAVFYLASFFAYGAYLRCRDWCALYLAVVSRHSNGSASTADSRVVSRSLRRWRHLLLCFSCAVCAMLSKEHGVTVIGVCVVFDLFIYSKLTAKDILYLFSQRGYRGRLEGVCCLVIMFALLVGARLLIAGAVAPHFSPSDNPAASCSCWLTRLRTFLYTPLLHFWLLLCPVTLSFDWSMDAVPLLTTWADVRSLLVVLVYGPLLLLICRTVYHHCVKKRSSIRSITPQCSVDRHKNGNATNGTVVKANGFSAHHHHNHHHYHYHQISGYCHQQQNQYVTSSRDPPIDPGDISSSTASIFSDVDSDASSQSDSRSADGINFISRTTRDYSAVCLLGLSMLVVPFLPATNLFFYVGFVVAERVLYIPSLGFCLLVGCGYSALCARSSRVWRPLLHIIATTVLVAMATRTVLRNRDWQNEESLYRSGIAVNPPKAYGNLANILSSRNMKELAEVAYKKALFHRPNMADAHYNLGILYQEQERFDLALSSYDKAIYYRPRMTMAYLNRGIVLARMGRVEEAAAVYRQCSQMDSAGLRDPRAHETARTSALFNLGRLRADAGDPAEAVDVYLQAVQIMPSHYQPQSLYNMLGEGYYQLGHLTEAEKWYLMALKAKPDHIPAHLTYAKLLDSVGRGSEAEQWLVKAVQLAPDQVMVYQHYGQYLVDLKRFSDAAAIYRKAVELAPTDYVTIMGAANVLRQVEDREEAERLYRTAVQLRPDDPAGHMNLGAMLHVNGKLEEAKLSYNEALRIQPNDQITKTNLQKLEQLLSRRCSQKSR